MSIETLKAAIAELNAAPKLDIKGKKYSTIATRVEVFRNHFGDEYGLVTKVLSIEDNFVRVMASVTHGDYVVATGLAEENRQNGVVNRTSALENCETSAIGRALAAFGLHGGEYGSANEVSDAIAQQEKSGGDLVKTKLKAMSHSIVSELHSCTDKDQLDAYWPTTKTDRDNMKTHYPEGLKAITEAAATMNRNLTDPAEQAEREAIQGEGNV